MGFECGFLSLNKHKDTTVEEAIKLSRAHDTDESSELDERLEKLMSYYKFHPEGEYGELPLTVNYWCSGGYKYLDEFITSHLNPYDENSYTGIDKNFIEKGISWAAQELCKIQLKPVQVLKAYRDENKKIETLMSCDGLEVLDENGNRKLWICLKGISEVELSHIIYCPKRYFLRMKGALYIGVLQRCRFSSTVPQ